MLLSSLLNQHRLTAQTAWPHGKSLQCTRMRTHLNNNSWAPLTDVAARFASWGGAAFCPPAAHQTPRRDTTHCCEPPHKHTQQQQQDSRQQEQQRRPGHTTARRRSASRHRHSRSRSRGRPRYFCSLCLSLSVYMLCAPGHADCMCCTVVYVAQTGSTSVAVCSALLALINVLRHAPTSPSRCQSRCVIMLHRIGSQQRARSRSRSSNDHQRRGSYAAGRASSGRRVSRSRSRSRGREREHRSTAGLGHKEAGRRHCSRSRERHDVRSRERHNSRSRERHRQVQRRDERRNDRGDGGRQVCTMVYRSEKAFGECCLLAWHITQQQTV
jgi:hypothetical protein